MQVTEKTPAFPKFVQKNLYKHPEYRYTAVSELFTQIHHEMCIKNIIVIETDTFVFEKKNP